MLDARIVKHRALPIVGTDGRLLGALRAIFAAAMLALAEEGEAPAAAGAAEAGR